MTKTVLLLIMTLLAAFTTNGQSKFATKLTMGTDGIQLKQDIRAFKSFYYLAELGIAAEGKDFSLNDPLLGIGMAYRFIDTEKHNLGIAITTGFCWVNHELFNQAVYYFTPQLQYDRFFGEKKKHGLSIIVGYKLGSTDYELTDENTFSKTTMIQTYKLQAFVFNLGYCIRF